MMTVQEVAERLAVSSANVYRLIESGQLIAHRIGIGRGTIRVSEEQLARFLADAETEPAEQKLMKRSTSGLKHLRL